ncbi:MAG TPA: hypothetical protein VG148_16520 [Pyrinomonadaceae bacterium]|nr:hypothetical protein [Pyrinomonadaceae bacterium]
MRLKITAGIGFGVLLIATVIATAKLQTKKSLSTTESIDSQIPVTTKQLSPENGIIPIELQCQVVRQPPPGEFRMLKCVVKNNTNKPVRALSVAYSISFIRNGAEISDSGHLTSDAYVHPDFQELNRHKFLSPGGEQVIVRGEPVQHDGAVAKDIEAEIDYVEFDDASALGPDLKGSTLLALIREGAATYKAWLKKKYLESGKSIDSIVPLLQDTPTLPAEYKVADTMHVVGVDAYRKYARELHNKRGATELEKRLSN